MYVIATTILMALAGAGDPAAPTVATAPTTASAVQVEFESCPGITTPLRDLQLAFGVSGRLKSVVVRRGDRVNSDQTMAQLDDEDLAATVQVLEVRAAGTHEIEAAEAAFRSASDTLARVQEAFAQQAAKQREVDEAVARADQALADLNLSRQRKREAELELQAARARHAKTMMKATFAGVVEEVRIEAGGAVDELAPVIRLVDDTAFRIDVAVPTELTLPLAVGETLVVRFRTTVPGGDTYATIRSLAHVADAASRTRIVRLEMANDRHLPAGLPVEVLVPKPKESVVSATGPAPDDIRGE